MRKHLISLTILYYVFLSWVFISIIFSHTGCKTSAEKNNKENTITAGELIPFVPENPIANIQCLRGSYPQIFNPESKAEWKTNDTSSSSQGITIELTLESSFPDISVAYDSVSLRGFNVYMLINETNEIYPTQIIVDKNLDETPLGTLRRFKRNVTLIFPYQAREILVPKEGLQNVHIYLLLNGFDTLFCFSWSPKQLPVEVPLQIKLKDTKDSLKEKGKTIHKKVLNWTHTFD